MDLARYLVDAVVVEHRSLRTVARAHGLSKSWVAVLVKRYRVGGYDAIAPQSKRPHTSPRRITPEIENAIITLRKELDDSGLDAGATTIAWHLQRQGFTPPSVSTIWRTLTRRGFITPQPKKRPHTSYIRFEAALPNECWQADTTHWTLADGTDVEILDIIDDHSRMIIAARVLRTVTGPDVLTIFRQACNTYGYPASVLTDNGAIFNARHRGGRSAFEQELATNNIVYKHSRPYHPQTCGKIERFHQTLKKALDQQPPARTIGELQQQLDETITRYNQHRPHRARGNKTPHQAFNERDHAKPGTTIAPPHFRVRTDKVDNSGKVTLRHGTLLCHIHIGRQHKGTKIRLYVADRDVRIITPTGEQLRHLTIDPTKRYQGLNQETNYTPEGSQCPR